MNMNIEGERERETWKIANCLVCNLLRNSLYGRTESRVGVICACVFD